MKKIHKRHLRQHDRTMCGLAEHLATIDDNVSFPDPSACRNCDNRYRAECRKAARIERQSRVASATPDSYFALLAGEPFGLSPANVRLVETFVGRMHCGTPMRDVLRAVYRKLRGPIKSDRRGKAMRRAMLECAAAAHNRNFLEYAAVMGGHYPKAKG